MSVMMARDSWTDERLDDLNAKVDTGFSEMRAEFRAVRSEMHEEFRAVRSELGGQIADLRRMTIQLFVGMLVGFVTTIATILTQM